MERQIEIHSDVSDSAMVGADGWGEFDAAASVSSFVQEVMDEVQKAYPGYAVTFNRTDHKNAVYITDERTGVFPVEQEIEEDQAAVRRIIGDVWERQSWLR